MSQRRYIKAEHPGNGRATQWEFRWVEVEKVNRLVGKGWRPMGMCCYAWKGRSVLIRREIPKKRTKQIELSVCLTCGGTGGVDSGGTTPWGTGIDLPCPECVND